MLALFQDSLLKKKWPCNFNTCPFNSSLSSMFFRTLFKEISAWWKSPILINKLLKNESALSLSIWFEFSLYKTISFIDAEKSPLWKESWDLTKRSSFIENDFLQFLLLYHSIKSI